MRLSDAIALGRTLVRPTPNGGPNPDEKSGEGCALQMAFAAIGDMKSAYLLHGPDFVMAEKIWGITANKCWKEFDKQAYKPEFSLDGFIDWVRSIEPAEESSDTPVESEVTETRESATREFTESN